VEYDKNQALGPDFSVGQCRPAWGVCVNSAFDKKDAMVDPKIQAPRNGHRPGSVARHSLAVLLATTALGVVSAHAVDGTWVSGSGEWVDGTSWSSNPVVPDGIATFTNTGTTAVTNNGGVVTIGEILFTSVPNAQAYAFTINNPFVINANGIINNSTNTQTFEVTSGNSLVFQNGSTASGGTGAVSITNDSGGTLDFEDTSSAGNSHSTIINNGIMSFNVGSTAGSANITNNLELDFFSGTSAGSAQITNAAAATLTFNNTATAGTSTIGNSGAIQFNNSSTAGSANITNANGATIDLFNSSSAGSATITNNSGANITFHDTSTAGNAGITNNNGATATFNDTSSGGTAVIVNAGALNFNNSATAGNANITDNAGGVLAFANSSTAGSAKITNNNGASLDFHDTSTAGSATIVNNNGGTTTFGVPIVGTDTATAGTANITNQAGGTTEFTAATTAGNATITNNTGGFLQFGDSGAGSSTASAGSSTITNNGTTSFNADTTAGSSTITTGSGGHVFFFNSSTGGNAQFITNAGGIFDMSGLTAAGMTAGSIAGAGSYVLGSKSLTVGSNNLSTTVSGVISGAGGQFAKVGTGTLTLTNTNTYTAQTSVENGTLVVNGSTAASFLTGVSGGATLAGTGTVGNTVIGAGGTLAPGSVGGIGTLNVAGTLFFSAAATYMIQVSPANAGRTNVTGTATLGGATVDAVFLPGSYVAKQYTIVNATGGVSGTFNPAVVSNMSNIQSTLTYDANDAFLNIKLSFVPPSGNLTINQQNVANALTNFFNSTGSIPAAFAGLNAAGLTIASGELGTGVIQSSIKADDLFLNLLLDPTIAGRAGGFTAPGGTASQYADDYQSLVNAARRQTSPGERDAYAMATKAPLMSAQPVSRWSVWGASYGGSETVGGNAVVGSQDTKASVYGLVAGADYKVSPDSLLGFALAGGGTAFSLANGLGSGSADVFQAGVYGRQNIGAAYLSAALAYGWHDVTTNRTVTLAGIDLEQGRFRADTFSGRFEGGYRFATPLMGITPYVAAQVISFNLPAYTEQTLAGAGMFALNYAAQTTTDSRTELGLRSDKSYAMQDGMLTLRGRLAWAHDYDPNRAATAIFQALPGANFVVNGARPDADSALVSAGAEMKWLNGFSVAATFEGEFSGNVTSYAGKGVVKYTW
jgi:uncharacterized protein with beta-barrel porin domain